MLNAEKNGRMGAGEQPIYISLIFISLIFKKDKKRLTKGAMLVN